MVRGRGWGQRAVAEVGARVRVGARARVRVRVRLRLRVRALRCRRYRSKLRRLGAEQPTWVRVGEW